MSAVPAARTDVTQEWLDVLYAGAEGWLTLFAQNRVISTQHVVWQPATNIAALVEQARQLSDQCCVWFGVATRKQRIPGKRGGAKDCLSIPGLWLDVDVAGPNHKGGQPLPDTLADAEALLGAYPLPPTAVVATGGGLQAFWLFPEHAPVDDGTAELLARWGHTWDSHARTRGWHIDNVFDLARIMRLPGTLNHKNQPTPVEILHADWDRRYNPTDLDQYTLDLPAGPEPDTDRRVPYIGPERPGDAFNATKGGGDVLGLAGFVLARRDRNGDEHWTGPWKTPREGTSATVYADGHTTMWSDTARDRWPQLELKRPYDPFGLYCVTQHGGNWHHATQALAAAGYGNRNMRDDDFSWVGDNTTPAADDDWPEPELIGAPDPDPYPLDVLPDWMADQCTAVAERLQVPVDLCAQIALGAWSAACAGHIRIRVTETYETHVNLYLATAMPSGAGKSPADKEMGAPLRELAQRVHTASKDDVKDAKYRRGLLERKLKDAHKTRDEAAIRDLEFELDDQIIPKPRRMIVDDATPEVLSQILADHGGRIAIVSAEAALLDQVCGRYASAGQVANLDVYLKGWSGERLIVDRKGVGGVGTEIDIPEVLLTVAVTVQPAALAALRTKPQLFGRGFIARFMYAVPVHRLGTREHRKLLDAGDTTIRDAYTDEFLRLAEPMQHWQFPVILGLGGDAVSRYLDWKQDMEPRLGDGGDLEPLREWVAKLHGTVPRVAGLLHLAADLDRKQPVGVEVMAQAIRLAEYWLSHAGSVLDLWEALPAEEIVRTVVQRKFVNEGVAEFTREDLYRWQRRAFERTAMKEDTEIGEVVWDVLQLLISRALIRTSDGARAIRAEHGRKRQLYVVNPALRRKIARIASIPLSNNKEEVSHFLYTSTEDPSNPRAIRAIADEGPAPPAGWLLAAPDPTPNGNTP